ncbi:MAG: IclR family transcriptional regulator [Deltaproteobacteria bacterium]|nr:IclR family transcriptional regulator [Deltaproteobacteria bacterium]
MEKKEEKTKSKYTGVVPAVDQASRILICLARNPSFKMNLTDICKNVGIHKSKGYSILNTLQHYGLVHKDTLGKTYSLGFGLISLSRKVLDNLNYEAIAGPYLEKLAKQTHSTALLGIIDNTNVFVVAKQEADQAVGVTTRIGHRFSITHGAHGKAIVSFLADADREKILHHNKLFFHGRVSKLNRKRLAEEIERCCLDGYAVDMGELNPGINVRGDSSVQCLLWEPFLNPISGNMDQPLLTLQNNSQLCLVQILRKHIIGQDSRFKVKGSRSLEHFEQHKGGET